jgi:hypothetical protein
MKIAMKAKTLISIISFVVAFSISIAAVLLFKGFCPLTNSFTKDVKVKDAETARRITSLLERDISNGRIRDLEILKMVEQGIEPSQAQEAALTRQYWQSSNSIETENLPDDFVKAWKKHMKAWEKYADFLEANHSSLETNAHYKCKAKKHIREISDTWFNVLEIAKGKYGAEIPEGAY